jgi:hypothetical protein
MPVKVKTDFKALSKLTGNVKKEFGREVTVGAIGYELVRTLQDLIMKGISPVFGAGRFKGYSDSYRKAIKSGRVKGKRNISPVTMRLTGEMLGSLRSVVRSGRVFIEFTDKKAAYHNFGKGNLPERKLLPQDGEAFTKRITQLILRALRQAIRKK